MSRVVSLYLPSWPTDRLRRQLGAAAPRPDLPLVIAGRDDSRRVVTAADLAAQALGIRPGLPLAEAQARIPSLQVAPADPIADATALERLAAWALRYSPIVAGDPPDGLVVDITGAAHLFGGETALLREVVVRLKTANIAARAAVADTLGAAHALARFAPEPSTIAAPGDTAMAMVPLPLAALRLHADCVGRLRRLGFETIGDLAATPRAPLALRFGPEPVRRLDQAFGHLAEPVEPIQPRELVQARRTFAEPIGATETLARYTAKLTEQLCPMLERHGLGARRLDLVFERVDGVAQAIRIGTARPVRDAKRLTRLLTDRIEIIDPGFGVEAMALMVSLVEPLDERQIGAFGEEAQSDVSALIDTLANRLGAWKVYRAAPLESDLPERTVKRVAPLAPSTKRRWTAQWPRPTRLISPPEPVETMALLPDHPPAAFVWRGERRRVIRADGPERVFGEWWRHGVECDAVRDYFMVEDESGERFWLYCSGDGKGSGDLRWFIHGIFA